jgi:ribosome recycling factor
MIAYAVKTEEGYPMIDDIMSTAKEKMQKSCAVYERDMQSLRAGRANPQLLDRILVDYYGTPTPINQIGNISSPEPRLLVIAPWEAKMIPQVEKAIQKSDLGLNPSNDGKIIRLVFPELNEERRRDLTKVASKGAEETKVAIRSIRRDAIEQIKKLKKNSEITEDDQHDAEDKMQKLTDKAIKEVDEIYARKEKEIMEV